MARIRSCRLIHKPCGFRYSSREEVQEMSRNRSVLALGRALPTLLTLGLVLAVFAPAVLPQQQPAFMDVIVFGLTTVPDNALAAIFHVIADLDAEEPNPGLIGAFYEDPRQILNDYGADISASAFGVTAVRLDLEPAPDVDAWIGIDEPLPESVKRPFAISYNGRRAAVIIQPVVEPDDERAGEVIDPLKDLIPEYLEAAGTMSTDMLDAIRGVLEELNEGPYEEIRRFVEGPRDYFQEKNVFFPSRNFRLIAIDVPLAVENGAFASSEVLAGLGTLSESIATVGERAAVILEPAF